jgi:hypothetical protein
MRNKITPHLINIGLFVVGLAAFCITLYMPQFRQIGLTFRYDFSAVILLFLVFILIPTFFPDQIGKPLQFIFFMMIWALPLAGLWGSANSEPGIIGGLLPTSDASGYFIDAMRLLNGDLISDFSGKRPIFSMILAVIVYLSGFQIQWVQSIFAFITALSAYFVMDEFEWRYGKIPGVLAGLILFIFYRRFNGLILTEQIGLTFGLLGLLLMVKAANNRKWLLYIGGTCLITIGLLARAGTFLVIPCLIIWGWVLFNQHSLKFKSALIGTTIVVILLGFGFNSWIDKVFASEQSAPFSNFSYSFYGLAQGGVGWTQVFTDHPEVEKMNNIDMTNTIYRLALDSIREHPEKLSSGIIKTYQLFFDVRGKSCIYCFFSSGDVVIFGSKTGSFSTMNLLAKIILFVLAALGIIYSILNRKKPVCSLVLFYFIGILLSVPFVPPGDADRMRVYAVIIPLLAFIPTLGLEWLLSFSKIKYLKLNFRNETPEEYVYAWSIFIILFCFITPALTIKMIAHQPDSPQTVCLPEEESVYFSYQKGLAINILPEQSISTITFPNISYGQYIRSIHNYDDLAITTELSNINPPTTIIKTEDLLTRGGLMLIADQNKFPNRNTYMIACGHRSKTPNIGGYGIFYANQLIEVKP